MKFQRRFANNFSFLNSYTFGRAIDLNSDNDGTVTLTNIFDPEYNRGPADYDVTHTFSSNWIYELPWAAQRAGGAAGRSAASSTCARASRCTITQSQSMQSTGHRQPAEPHLRRRSQQPDDRQVVRHGVLPAADRHHRHLRRHRPRHRARSRPVQHRLRR